MNKTAVATESEDETLFSTEEELSLKKGPIPQHIAIIMDGNRRWAQKQGLPKLMGHWEGAEVLTDIVKGAAELGVKTLTVFCFSTENWTRSETEVNSLMDILEVYLAQKQDLMIRRGVKLEAIGDISALPERVRIAFENAKNATAHCSKITLVLALNYGGRDEIRRAMTKILQLQLKPSELTEELIANHLDTSTYGDPDLLIRTSGELRVSNFLLWQISYAEIYTTEVLWPDFMPKHLFEAILEFQSRERRKGGGS